MLDKLREPVIIALGFFDSVHLGHKKVIEKTIELAKKHNVKPAVFSFKDNVKKVFGIDDGQVFTTEERKNIFDCLGVKNYYFAPASKNFLSMGRLKFLHFLEKKFKVVGYCCGDDYRFGKGAKGDADFLQQYALKSGKVFYRVSEVLYENKRISTTLIKTNLLDGNIEYVNKLLGMPYFVSGTVFSDRGVGNKIGYPTLNLNFDSRKSLLKQGVYAGHVYINGKEYKAIINYGNRPTFNLDKTLIEAHVIDFNGNLYGQTIIIYFDKYLRDIIKFNGVEQLKNQLCEDMKKAKE